MNRLDPQKNNLLQTKNGSMIEPSFPIMMRQLLNIGTHQADKIGSHRILMQTLVIEADPNVVLAGTNQVVVIVVEHIIVLLKLEIQPLLLHHHSSMFQLELTKLILYQPTLLVLEAVRVVALEVATEN